MINHNAAEMPFPYVVPKNHCQREPESQRFQLQDTLWLTKNLHSLLMGGTGYSIHVYIKLISFSHFLGNPENGTL